MPSNLANIKGIKCKRDPFIVMIVVRGVKRVKLVFYHLRNTCIYGKESKYNSVRDTSNRITTVISKIDS
jgi:hypothetical protein